MGQDRKIQTHLGQNRISPEEWFKTPCLIEGSRVTPWQEKPNNAGKEAKRITQKQLKGP